jgi:hypothetical protein
MWTVMLLRGKLCETWKMLFIQTRAGNCASEILGKLQGEQKSPGRSFQHIFVGRNGRLYCRRSGCVHKTLVPHVGPF